MRWGPQTEIRRSNSTGRLEAARTAGYIAKYATKSTEENYVTAREVAERLGLSAGTMQIDPFESWAEIDAIIPEFNLVGGVLVEFLVGTGVRPEEAFGAEWRDVQLDDRVVTVQRAFAKGRLKHYAKTERSRRRVPLRARTAAALGRLERRRGILFPTRRATASTSTTSGIAHWTPSLEAAGVQHRRIYDCRHTYATWSLAAGVDIFTLSRRMGTSVAMIDRTYGHLAAGADEQERGLLDAFDGRASEAEWALFGRWRRRDFGGVRRKSA